MTNSFAEVIYVNECTRYSINIRTSPTRHSKSVGSVSAGQKLIKYEENNGWYMIETESGTKGWIKSDFLTENESKQYIIKGLNEKINELSTIIEKQDDNIKQLKQTIQKLEKNMKSIQGDFNACQQRKLIMEKELAQLNDINLKFEIIKKEYELKSILLTKCDGRKNTYKCLFIICLLIIVVLLYCIWRIIKRKTHPFVV